MVSELRFVAEVVFATYFADDGFADFVDAANVEIQGGFVLVGGTTDVTHELFRRNDDILIRLSFFLRMCAN